MSERIQTAVPARPGFASHGWAGLALVLLFWTVNWTFEGPRTAYAFFPMWVGYCLVVDALVLMRRGTSLLFRSWRKFVGLFIVSTPVWWIFEFFNLRLNNWFYSGGELFTPLQFGVLATLSFSTVIPAVFGTAELMTTFGWFQRLKPRGPVIPTDRRTTILFFLAGWAMLGLMWIWPLYFFPFVWISVYFILEPLNIWLGNRTLGDTVRKGDWRPILALWAGVLITAFFWEMWNFLSYPKWVYQVPWVDVFHIFEMPLLGYGGYLPFALELYAMYHLIVGFFGHKGGDYVQISAGRSSIP